MFGHLAKTLHFKKDLGEVTSERDQAREVADLLLEKKKEAEVKLLAQTEEIEKLKIEMKALKKENNELSFHLT